VCSLFAKITAKIKDTLTMPEKESSKTSSETEKQSQASAFSEELDDQLADDEVSEDNGSEIDIADKNTDQDAEVELPEPIVGGAKQGKIARFRQWMRTHKKTTVLLLCVVLLAILAAVPWSRYAIAGTFLKQTVTIKVLDSKSNKPVSSASVVLDGHKAITNNNGFAYIKVPVGNAQLAVSKKYYTNAGQTVLAPILKPKHENTIRLTPTGRQVTVTVVNKISNKPVENVAITFDDAESKTDKQGKATLVLPADKQKVSARLHGNGFNEQNVELIVNATDDKANSFAMTPSGKLYFLSNLNGKVDVVKTSLDGSSRQVVVAGSGSEDQSTVLLAARDWKYLALLSKHDGGKYAKLFLIDTSTDKMTVMDEGSATFKMIGWDGHRFVYSLTRSNEGWQNKHQALKSFDAESGKLATLDETGASGDTADKSVYESFGEVYIQADGILYAKNWSSGYNAVNDIKNKQATLNLVQSNGSGKHVVRSFDKVSTYAGYYDVSVYLKSYAAEEIYLLFNDGPGDRFYEYEDGKVKDASITNDDFYGKFYPTYLLSPSGQHTFWAEPRDGKNTLFVGDQLGKNGKQVANLSEDTPYGWYSDQYILVAKKGSELYIMPVGGGQPLKITDYYKPSLSFPGYGYGYGGL
jgi:hypothetical protein